MPEDPPVWLSGALLTLLNKLLFPCVWLGCLGGILLAAFVRTGRISIASDFRFFAALLLAATVFMLWTSARLQRVGYSRGHLVVANYWREARIPFHQVEAVEPVWWYRNRMVRIRFNQRTAFGSTVYYLPKWGPLRAMFDSPDKQLKEILSAKDLQ
jgi:hypothetical protein